jgi:multidrug resistance protein
MVEHEHQDVEAAAREKRELNEVREGGDGLQAATATSLPDDASSQTAATHADLEKQQASLLDDRSATEEKQPDDPNLVTWDSPDSQENPRNWPRKRKWAIMVLVSSFTFFSPLSSSMIAPALPLIAQDLNITSSIAQNLVLSVFVLAYAFGPLFLGPLSEMFGRRPVIQLSSVFFIAWTMACALAQTQGELTAFRFLAGLGGSAPLTTGGGTVGDLFVPEQRGKAMAMYSLAPLLGPVVGPIIGAAVTQYVGSWRWIFGIATILSATPAILGVFFLRETYAPQILAAKCARLRKETGNDKLHTAFQIGALSWRARFRVNLSRPFVLLTTQPIILVLALYMSLIYGTMYLLLTEFNSIFIEQYNESTFIASLNYISLGLGFTAGGQIGGRVIDILYRRLKARNGGVGTPEHKLPVMFVGAWLIPIGLIIFGFTVQYRVFWLVPNIGAFIFGCGMMSVFLCLQNYTVDFYSVFAASALSSVGLCRSLCGFGLPLAAPSLFDRLGYDYGTLLLAAITAVLGIPAPFLFYKFGPWLRERSTYASTTG